MHKSDICICFFFPECSQWVLADHKNQWEIWLLWNISCSGMFLHSFSYVLSSCTAVGPVHSRLTPGSAVGKKWQKTEWNGLEKIGGLSVDWGEGKGGLLLPRLSLADFFCLFPQLQSLVTGRIFFTQIDRLSIQNQRIRSPKPLSRLVY